MSYTTSDFSESRDRVRVELVDIDAVVAAWGKGDGMGDDAGHLRWAEDGATDWCGGFLVRLRDGRFAYITGWCDYTGWGCQDGAQVFYYDARPEAFPPPGEYGDVPPMSEWDVEPIDLNRWLQQQSTGERTQP